MYIIDRHFVKRQGRNRAYIKINGGIFSAGIKFEGVNTQFGYLTIDQKNQIYYPSSCFLLFNFWW